MGAQEDFDRLQAVSDQFAPHPQHHGPSASTLVTGGIIAGLIYRNAQHRAQVRDGQRPGNLKDGSVLVWYLLAAAVIHVLLGSALLYFVWDGGPVAFWLIYGPLVWIPAWILGIRHQQRENAYNRGVWDRFHQTEESAAPTLVQGPRISEGFDDWYRSQKHQN